MRPGRPVLDSAGSVRPETGPAGRAEPSRLNLRGFRGVAELLTLRDPGAISGFPPTFPGGRSLQGTGGIAEFDSELVDERLIIVGSRSDEEPDGAGVLAVGCPIALLDRREIEAAVLGRIGLAGVVVVLMGEHHR